MFSKALIFTYVMTYGGALASLVRPFYGLVIYVVFAIVKPEALWFWAVPRGNYSRTVAIGLLIGWVINGMGDWKLGRAKLPIYALLAYWAWAAIEVFVSPRRNLAIGYLDPLSKIALPAIVGVTIIDSIQKLKFLAWTIVVSQAYVAYEMNMYYLSGYNYLYFNGFAGLDNNGVAVGFATAIGPAFFLGMNAEKWYLKALGYFSAAVLAHGVMISFSRGGMLGMAIAGFVSFCMIRKSFKHYVAFALAGIAAIYMAGDQVREEFMSSFSDDRERDFSSQSRIDLWKQCVQCMIEQPLFGIGPDHWPLRAKELGWGFAKEAHSLWFQVGAEMGFPGLIFLCSFYGFCALRLLPIIRGWQQVTDPWYRYIAQGVVASLAGFVISAQFVTIERLELPYYIAMLGAGVLKLGLQAPPDPYQAPRPFGASAAFSRVEPMNSR